MDFGFCYEYIRDSLKESDRLEFLFENIFNMLRIDTGRAWLWDKYNHLEDQGLWVFSCPPGRYDGMPMNLGCKAPCVLQMQPHGQSMTFLLKTRKQGKQSQQMQPRSVSPGPALWPKATNGWGCGQAASQFLCSLFLSLSFSKFFAVCFC